jgi:hypothetical protein
MNIKDAEKLIGIEIYNVNGKVIDEVVKVMRRKSLLFLFGKNGTQFLVEHLYHESMEKDAIIQTE